MPTTRITYTEDEIKELLSDKHETKKHMVSVRIVKGHVDSRQEQHPDSVEFYVDLPKKELSE